MMMMFVNVVPTGVVMVIVVMDIQRNKLKVKK